MKLVCYMKEGHEQLAMLVDDILYDMDMLHPELPSTMSMFLNYWDEYFPLAKAIHESILEGKMSLNKGIPAGSVLLISPIPLPASCRETGKFSASSRYPSFIFTNHHSVFGPGEISCMPDHFKKLDFEPGISVVISSTCKNITAAEAEQYIGGYMITIGIRNKTGETTADIANIFGPWLVTPDELEPFIVETTEGHTGTSYNLPMKCSINGELLSEGNLSGMNWTFAEIIESCAYGSYLQPGDIIGTSAFGNGVFTKPGIDNQETKPDHTKRLLQDGDLLDVEVEGLGKLSNVIIADESDFTLLESLQ